MKLYLKIEKTVIKFGDIEIEKQKFRQHKRPIMLYYINEIIVCNEDAKISYEDAKIRLLCILLPKMNAYRRDFDETEYMSFLIKDGELLEKYNEIWEKLKNIIQKGFDSEPVYN